MTEPGVRVQKWIDDRPPDEAEIRRRLNAEGLSYYRWSNAQGAVYAAHTHSYHKVITVVKGSITFGLPAGGSQINLHPGDRLELPPGVVHDALVGPEGVVCLEAHRP
jgi:quercetin dioxygenase-like cupin family protein